MSNQSPVIDSSDAVVEAESVNVKKKADSTQAHKNGNISIEEQESYQHDIAIIGMACRFPGAEDYDKFWENLRRGISSVGEIPEQRWDKEEFYSPSREDINRSVSKWGGFIKDVDKFDAPLFKISPREAELMDPQQRIMLELAWGCMEDAGYRPSQLKGSSTAVYLGVCNFDYKEIVERSLPSIEGHVSTGIHTTLIPNRISYEFDFKGPSMPIDTACSSSLVAVAEAVHALQRGDCSLAFVGGISILCSPTHFISFSKTGMLSPTGSIKTFDESADGYVRGEGAGIVLLKPLQQAIKDKDNIHGVIKGVAMNHGGAVSTITSPNPFAQSQVIISAFQNAGIGPASINYIEAHGTGTPKGDPVEFNGIKRAYSSLEKTQNEKLARESCGIGSVKTNIGHLEAASGIAGMIKVLLSMKHQTLPPMLNFRKLNPRIKLDGSPFYIVDETRDWKPGSDGLRTAGVSSFGFGGVNAHVILQEYPGSSGASQYETAPASSQLLLFVLSAKNKHSLKRYAKRLQEYLRRLSPVSTAADDMPFSLESFLYTLQEREPMEERMAFEVSSFTELTEKLAAYCEDEVLEDSYSGNIKSGAGASDYSADEVDKWLIEKASSKLATYWVQGGVIDDWSRYYLNTAQERQPHKIHLPTYPFTRNSYWIEHTRHVGQTVELTKPVDKKPGTGEILHPLLHKNTANLYEQKFTSLFTGDEFFLNDHKVEGHKVLPGVAHLEMARAAIQYAVERPAHWNRGNIQFKNIVWMRPVAVDDMAKEVNIGLYPQQSDKFASELIHYEIYSGNREYQPEDEGAKGDITVHSQGEIGFIAGDTPPSLVLSDIIQRLRPSHQDARHYYAAFKELGLDYGPAHQGIEQIYTNENNSDTPEVLAKLKLPDSVSATGQDYILHPSLLDSALQASLGMGWIANTDQDAETRGPWLPFALNQLEIVGSFLEDGTCPDTLWAWIRSSKANKRVAESVPKATGRLGQSILDIELCDEQGRVFVVIRGLALREVGTRRRIDRLDTNTTNQLLLARPVWTEHSLHQLISNQASVSYDEHRVLVVGTDYADGQRKVEQLAAVCAADSRSHICFDTLDESADLLMSDCAGASRLAQRFEACAMALLKIIQRLGQAKPGTPKPKQPVLLQLVVPAEGMQQMFSALSGLLKVAHLEHPKIIGQIIQTKENDSMISIMDRLIISSRHPESFLFRFDGEKCWNGSIEELVIARDGSVPIEIPWKEGGVYLITGGLGGLGKIFAGEIASRLTKATLILTGRSPLSKDKLADIKTDPQNQVSLQYQCLDVCDAQAVQALMHDIQKYHGGLNGIIHCAGLIADNYISKKTEQEFSKVLAPKIQGLVNLHDASKDIALDSFVLFSSTAGAFGNIGQADYATANAFMDAFSQWRNTMHSRENCFGRTLSINWPLWQDGGMTVDAATEQMLKEKTGMVPLKTHLGIEAFYRALASNEHQVMVLEGCIDTIKEKLFSSANQVSTETSSRLADNDESIDRLQSDLVGLCAKLLKLDADDLDTTTELSEYGFDSITLTELANRLNEKYRIELAPTVFFDYPTIESFARYLLEEHRNELVDFKDNDQLSVSANEANQRLAESNLAQSELLATGQADIRVDATHDDEVSNKIQSSLLEISAKLLKLNTEDLDTTTELSEYGFDSITLTELANRLNEKYRIDLTPTVFFDYPTIESFAQYLLQEHGDRIVEPDAMTTVGLGDRQSGDNDTKTAANRVQARLLRPRKSEEQAPTVSQMNDLSDSMPSEDDTTLIAIVGMSGSFPMADNLSEYWHNLNAGKDCISEIPKQRWDWEALFGDPVEHPRKSNVKWGGFMDGMDEFDPLFFGISPREARSMDPQQRLLMTHVWSTIEDAGHSAACLSGSHTGVFVGTAVTGYGNLLSKSDGDSHSSGATGTIPSIGPNRTSFLLNFHGPSEPIETACSSSLVAIHRAVVAMQVGDCDQAIAGGVNTIPNEDLHISFNKAGMLSPDGRCKTFSKDANGYVRGEGVGMLFLKKLQAAEQAGDHIYGIIRASAMNHGGRANSLTAPNSIRQSEVLVKAYKKAGIDPRTVTYIETHGTGTSLGDPIEINGIKTAFKRLYQDFPASTVKNPHCALGAVKTNIGHLELAAGVAGVIKVLLQFQHKRIAKNLHFNEVNPYIDLQETPFYFSQEPHDWEVLQDKDGKEIPRRAGVSSFGFGGVNAHIVLEEYQPKARVDRQKNVDISHRVMVPLSAKNPERLKQYAENLLKFIRKEKAVPFSVRDLAYTFQVGRDAMDERLGIIVQSIEELAVKLWRFIDDQEEIADLYLGKGGKNKDLLADFSNDEDLQAVMETWIKKGKYGKFMKLWVKGMEFDWQKLYSNKSDRERPCRISAPTYPFEKLHYWPVAAARANDVQEAVQEHRQLDSNRVTEPLTNEDPVMKILKDLETGHFSIDEAITALPE